MHKFSFQSLLTRICVGGLALLGFGCEEEGGGEGGECMYGTPVSSFEIKGKVVTEDGNDVVGASVRVTDPQTPSGVYSYNVTKTGEDGTYISAYERFPSQNKAKVVCIPADPALEADSVTIDMKYNDNKHKNDPWYFGHADATVDFTLKKKKADQ